MLLRSPALIVIAAVCLTLRASGADAAARGFPWPHETSDLAPSPRVTFGRLDNGLRFAVVPNTTPPGRVSLRLLVLAGSLHESDDERGYAHFVEHMAFNGTRSFAAGELVKFLQRQGAAVGPHVNAATTFTHTLYKLELPENSAATLGTGLRVLRDFADGILFDKREVARERGVILSEALARHSPEESQIEARIGFVFAGTPVPERLPIGVESTVKSANRERLQNFYDAWYRPERMLVVVAGAAEPDDVAAMVRETFGSLEDRAPARSEPDTALPATADGGAAIAIHREAREGIQFELGAVQPKPAGGDTSASRRDDLRLEAAHEMIGRRLEQLKLKRDAPISAYSVNEEHPLDRFRRVTLATGGAPIAWKTVLGAGEQELRRALEHGFDASELAAAQKNLRLQILSSAESAGTISSDVIADALAQSIESGEVFTFPDEREEELLREIDALTPEDCVQALRAVWTAGARTLFVTVDASFPLAVEEVRAALDESSAVALEPPAALESVAFAYPDFGEPGEVVERAYVEDLDLWLVRFANGVRLNLKRTAFEKQSVRFSLRFGTGRLEEPATQPGLHLWLPALIYGGLGRQNYADMSRALTGRGVNISAHTGLDAFEFSGDARTADLPTNLQVLAAYIADPGFRPEGRERALAGLYSFYNALRQSPELVFRLAIEPYLAGGDPRFGTPPRNKVENYTIDDLRAWIGPALKNGPVEIGIIGDIDIDATIDAVARTLGTLPARAQKPSLADRRILKFPEAPQSKLHTYTATARPATLAFYWPVHDALTTATKRHLLLLAGVFEDRLRVKIREEKGETYSPDADFNASDAYPGDARISCRLDVRPDRAKKVGESVRDIARSLARDGVTEEELQRAKAQALAAAQQMVRDNGFWLETVLGDVQERPERIGEIRTLEEDFANATKADLDALCARYLGEKNLLRYIIEAKAPKR